MRKTLLVTLAIGFAGCSPGDVPEAERAAAEAAAALEARGETAAARDAWKQLRETAQDRRSNARAELAIARIDVAIEARDRAVARLLSLGTSSGTLSASDLGAAVDDILRPFTGGPFEAELAGHRERILGEAALGAPQDPDVGSNVRALAAAGDFSAALEALGASISAAPNRTQAGVALAREIEASADSAATALLERVKSARRTEEEIEELSTALPRFRGTHALARIVVALDAARAALVLAESGGAHDATREDH